jgi:hypothetical protein
MTKVDEILEERWEIFVREGGGENATLAAGC